MRNSFKFILPIIVPFSILFLSTTTLASIYLNVSATPIIQPGVLINITGSVATTGSDSLVGINVSANTSNVNHSVTDSSGFFNFTVVAPSVLGPYNISINTNSSSLINKTISFTVVNETGSTSSIKHHLRFPPFSAGTTFTINITLKNGTSPLQSILPNVSVYAANGVKTSWTIVNNSASTDANGIIQFNVTIPSGTSPGDYAIVVDNGALFSGFQVGSGYMIAVQTLTASSEISSFFPPSSALMILAKVRDSSGTPVTGATVSAVITFPNGTTLSSPVILSSHPSSAGYYNNTFSDTSASGSYKVKVTATISGTNVTSSGIFNTQRFIASLEPQKNFFFEWGGQGSFKPNSTFVLDIVPLNLADGSTITNSSCPSTSYALTDLTYPNGTSVLNTFFANSALTNYSFVTSTSPSGSVCSLKFGNDTVNSNISVTGVYNAKVNVTQMGESHIINGFFSIQNYFLKVVPVLSLGGEDDFMQVVAPGSNITIAVKAVNVSTGNAVLPSNITNFTVTSILPLEFTSGTNETTTISQTSISGTDPSTDPTINMILPSTIMGPLLIKVQATISPSNQTITGDAFLIANYLLGGVSTQGISVEGKMGGPGEGEPSGGGGMLCGGTQTFSGTVQDAATGVAAQGATIVGILQAREDETGKDVSSYLSIASASASDSNGQLSTNITFSPSGYSFSGNYFMVLNATYKNVSAGVPGFFQCKNLNTGFANVRTAGTTSNMGFFVSPTAALILSFDNVTNMTGSLINTSSTLTITQVYNFNPATGSMKILVNNTPLVATFYSSSGTVSANITFYPQNFSIGGVNLTQWPNGFFDVRPTIKAGVTGATNYITDTSNGGFMVVAFNAFPESFGFGSVSVGSIATTIIDIQANGTYNNTNGAWNVTSHLGSSNTLINITIGRPWEGEMTKITGVNATLLTDGWNYTSNSTNFGGGAMPFERWNITYVIPTTVKKGFAMLTITVNATANGTTGFNQVDVPLALSVSKYNVIIPSQEGVGDQTGGSTFDGYGVYYGSPILIYAPAETPIVNQTAYGSWNVTYLYTDFHLNSTSQYVCVKNQFNSARYGQTGSQSVIYNTTTKLMLIDNATPGVYNTVVFNFTSGSNTGTIVVLDSSHRNLTVPDGAGGIYLWDIHNCGYFTIVNSSKISIAPQGSFVQSYGGSHQSNTNFAIPYVVSLGGAASPQFQSSASVGIKGVGQQNAGKNGGFGFTGKLVAGTTDYNATGATTDANGVAFVNLTVGRTGNFMAFWNVTISGDTDAATFSSATFFDSRAFDAYTNIINSSAVYRVIVFNNETSGDGIYNGTLATQTDGTLYVLYDYNNSKFALNFSAIPAALPNVAYNQSLNLGSNNYKIAWITPNITTGHVTANNQTLLIYRSDNLQTGVVSVTSATQNVTVSICGQGFTGQPPRVTINMTINNVTTEDWSRGGTIKTLTIYELMNNTNATINGVRAGIGGCALLNVGPGQLGSWPSSTGFAPPVFLNAYVTNTTDAQQIYVTNVFRTG